MKFHIAHIVPRPEMHGLNGYQDVIDSFAWGLKELGHEVSVGLNTIDAGARNIVFGAQVMKREQAEQLPKDTIVYNLEQIRTAPGEKATEPRPEIQYYLERFQIWDYSAFNLERWRELRTRYPVKNVKVGYAPVLERIPRAELDIDVLFYGLPSDVRFGAFGALTKVGLKSVFVVGLYGAARDSLIARSKVILNIGLYNRSRIFEIVRASYLFANHKAVAAYVMDHAGIEPDIEGAFKASTNKTFVDDVHELATDDAARQALEERAYEAIRRRDIKQMLEEALG